VICLNSGKLSVKNDDMGTAVAGGILGFGSIADITGCGNLGDVGVAAWRAIYLAGGIIGEIKEVNISNCFNIGSIRGSTASGIVGETNGVISNCFNLGTISALRRAGGILGEGHNLSFTSQVSFATAIMLEE